MRWTQDLPEVALLFQLHPETLKSLSEDGTGEGLLEPSGKHCLNVGVWVSHVWHMQQ